MLNEIETALGRMTMIEVSTNERMSTLEKAANAAQARVDRAVAGVASVLAVALCIALQAFLSVDTPTLVAVTAVVGLWIGVHLPPAGPARRPRRTTDHERLAA